MLKKRLIAALLVKNGFLVKTRNFANHQVIGSPLTSLEQFNMWAVDEIAILDISEDSTYSVERKDINYQNPDSLPGIVSYISESCFVPLTVGGGINSIEDISIRIKSGADKVILNGAAVRKPEFIAEAARSFGKQCIVVAIDIKRDIDGRYEVFIDNGKTSTGLDPMGWAKVVEYHQAGEILLNSIDKDGTMAGFDVDIIKTIAGSVSIPVIACGGAGEWSDFADAIVRGGAQAVCAANIFHFREQSTRLAKKAMKEAGVDVRYTESFVPKIKAI
ncbi:imidazole glycerol phosphate synthase subunit HisF [Candidatus Omnitrophota bacterium]